MPADLEQTFLVTIQRDERPQLTQRIYADWLEEQGDPRAGLLRLAATARDEPRDTWVRYVAGDSPCQLLWELVLRLMAAGQLDYGAFQPWSRLARLPDGWKDCKQQLWKWDEPGTRSESGSGLIRKLNRPSSAPLEHRVLNTLESAADPRPFQTWYAGWLEPHDPLRAAMLRQSVTIRTYPRNAWIDFIDGHSLCSLLWDGVVSYLSAQRVEFGEFYQWARRARIPNGWREQERNVWKWDELEMSGYD